MVTPDVLRRPPLFLAVLYYPLLSSAITCPPPTYLEHTCLTLWARHPPQERQSCTLTALDGL